MTSPSSSHTTSRGDLRRRLVEAEETLTAIRSGDVDAVVVESPTGQQVYCLESPDQPFRVFVEQMQEGALTVNADGTIVYCNRFFANLVQRPVEQVRGQPLSSLVAPDHRQALEGMLQTAGGEVVHGQSWLQQADGATVPVQMAFNRLPAEDVRMFGVVITDLTERQHAEHLQIERRAAEEAKLARDNFLAVMSHELRAPLSAILGWAQVIRRREDLPELVQQGLEVIERNAWVQSHLIEDLLDVSRILAGKLRMDLKPTDLGGVIRATVASARPSAEARHINVDVQLPAAPLRVRGDAERLQQIISNLLSNAIKFSPERRVVRVALREQGPWAEIVVADSGAGIAPGLLPRLFDLYQQGDSPTGDSAGLGLGLAIVKQLTEVHGGQVFAHSDGAGLGAVFTVRLPLLEGASGAADADTASPAGAAALQGIRLLVAEDQADEREVLAHLLSGAGAEVVVAATAAEALQIVEHQTVDLLISAVGLPDMDGFELIRRIREGGRSRHDLPAIAITAFPSRQNRRQALRAGYQMNLSKPLDQDELHAAVASLAGPRGGNEGRHG